MLKIFTGDDRVRAGQEIKRELGDNYEIVEGADLTLGNLPSLFYGATLFDSVRRILIRDLSTNKPIFEKLPDYLDTPHQIIILELKLDKRSTTYKTLKNQIIIKDFTLPKDPNFGLVFDIYKTAHRDGKKAVTLLRKIEPAQDPMMFFGLLASQALKDFNAKQGTKEKQVLRELAQLDLQMKSTSIEPWLLIEGFLLKLG